MSWYPLDGAIFFIGIIAEQGPLHMIDVTDSSWQWDTGQHFFNIPSRLQESRISIGLSQGLDWREVMSWYTVGGAAYTVTGTAQQEPGSIDACWWSSLLRASVISRGSAQSKPWDMGDDWPSWHGDPGGLFDDRYNERSV